MITGQARSRCNCGRLPTAIRAGTGGLISVIGTTLEFTSVACCATAGTRTRTLCIGRLDLIITRTTCRQASLGTCLACYRVARTNVILTGVIRCRHFLAGAVIRTYRTALIVCTRLIGTGLTIRSAAYTGRSNRICCLTCCITPCDIT